MDPQTKRYRTAELNSLTHSCYEYKTQVQFYDSVGNKTKFLSITHAEFEQIKAILTGK